MKIKSLIMAILLLCSATNIWLPVPSSTGEGNYVTPSMVTQSAPSFYNNDKMPYSQFVYEASSINRVLEQVHYIPINQHVPWCYN